MSTPRPTTSTKLPPSLRSVDEPAQVVDTVEEESTMGMAEYARVLLRYKLSILSIVVIAAIIGAMQASSAPPIFRAEVRLLSQMNLAAFSAGGLNQFDSVPAHWLYFETQRDILRSRVIAEQVVDRLQLAVAKPRRSQPSSENETSKIDSPEPNSIFVRVKDLLGFLRDWREWIPPEWRKPPPPPLSPEEQFAARRDAQIGRVLGGTIIEGGERSEVLVVGFQSGDPKEAAAVANAVAEAYIEFGLQSRSRNVQEASGWITERLDELRGKLAESEIALREFQSREGLVDTESQGSINTAQLQSLTTQQIRLSADRTQAEARYNELRAAIDGSEAQDTLVPMLGGKLLVDLNSERTDLKRRISELGERYGEKHPRMIAARAELGQVERDFRAQIEKGVEAARQELGVIRAAESKVRALVEAQQQQIRARSGKAFQLSQLEREVESNRALVEVFFARSREADIQDSNNFSNVRIIDRARVPRGPSGPNRARIVTTTVIMGLVFGVMLAMLRNHLDNTFKTRADVERNTGLPVLGVIPKRRGKLAKRAALTASDEPLGAFSEAINDVRTSIMLSHLDDPPKVVLLTSTLAGEGKTTLATNLSIAFSQRGRTLLLEADLRRGSLASALMVEDAPGLTDFVAGDCTLQDALLQINEIPNLFLMQGGTSPPNPIDVLSSHKFNLGLHNLRKAFDYIVIDSSPIMPVSDSAVLGNLADVVLLVIQSERTSQSAVKDALKRLSAARIRPIGAVLQQTDIKRSAEYGNYYGGYTSYYAPNRA